MPALIEAGLPARKALLQDDRLAGETEKGPLDLVVAVVKAGGPFRRLPVVEGRFAVEPKYSISISLPRSSKRAFQPATPSLVKTGFPSTPKKAFFVRALLVVAGHAACEPSFCKAGLPSVPKYASSIRLCRSSKRAFQAAQPLLFRTGDPSTPK